MKSSHVPGLSFRVAGSDGLCPSAPKSTRFGPIAPRFKYTDAAPGPPLKANVTGLPPGTLGPSMMYDVNTTSPTGLPSVFFTGSVPTVAVYLSALPSN